MKPASRAAIFFGFALIIFIMAPLRQARAAATNTVVFLETMATNGVKPWTGSGCSYPWTVAFNTANPFEQNANLAANGWQAAGQSEICD